MHIGKSELQQPTFKCHTSKRKAGPKSVTSLESVSNIGSNASKEDVTKSREILRFTRSASVEHIIWSHFLQTFIQKQTLFRGTKKLYSEAWKIMLHCPLWPDFSMLHHYLMVVPELWCQKSVTNCYDHPQMCLLRLVSDQRFVVQLSFAE